MTCCGISGGQIELFLRRNALLDNTGLGDEARVGTTPNAHLPVQSPNTATQTSTSASLGKRCLSLLKKIGIASLECYVCLLTCDLNALRCLDPEPASAPNAGPNRLQNHAANYMGRLPPQSVLPQSVVQYQSGIPYQAEVSFAPSVGFNPTQSEIQEGPSLGWNPTR